MGRCRLSPRCLWRATVAFAAAVSFLWLVSLNLGAPAFPDEAAAAGVRRVVSAPPPEDGEAYSSLYCVGHKFNDPRSATAAPSSFAGRPAHGPRDRADGAVATERVDVAVNGVLSPDLVDIATLTEPDMTMGSMDSYYYPIYNRTCLYTFVYFDNRRNKFFFYLQNTSTHRRLLAAGKLNLPPVSLSSRPLELPRAKAETLRRKSRWAFAYTPVVVLGRRPREKAQRARWGRHDEVAVPHHNMLVAYFLPTVAPWNFAHTLLCDLFGFFWGSMELQRTLAHAFPAEVKFLAEALPDAQLLAASFRYFPQHRLPNSNKAFAFMSRRPAIYDLALPSGVYRGLLAGTGTKSWSWVSSAYAASGSPALWYAFRHYIVRITGAQQPSHRSGAFAALPGPQSPLRVSICQKKDKRGILNDQELLLFLQKRFGSARSGVEFLLESIVGHSAREQVEMMLATDIFVCNEGTLATTFFLMNPGSVFVAIPLVYHSPHLHRRNISTPDAWWSLPDLIRVDPRFNTGGNIDWFPPTIPWVRLTWYSEIPLSETSIQQPLRGLHNYMPDYNVRINLERFASLMQRAIAFVRGRGTLWRVHFAPTPFKENAASLHFSHDAGSTAVVSFEARHHYRAVFLDPANWTDVVNNISLRRIFYLHESHVESRRFRGRTHRPPNYSVTADQCRRLMHLRPALATCFNTALCRYGMSWLCEMFANGRYSQRFFHDKWRLSRGRCGGVESWPEYWRQRPELLRRTVLARAAGQGVALLDLAEATDYFFDVRETLNLSRYLYFDREDLEASYRSTDLGPNLRAEGDAVRRLFG
ncbi:glycosyltransferase [Trypanosoma conorhini]|uniref:Glycosyltransferase n=1 Tax=Trypanosoma conorhini TaxID=83891 RepID=A0A3R7MZG9_9TRYP|nr:glycosyltransferase [Trypanosoma conorhini]RNF23009.1 glycosyltransferase [Trypanosoma conorhini]